MSGKSLCKECADKQRQCAKILAEMFKDKEDSKEAVDDVCKTYEPCDRCHAIISAAYREKPLLLPPWQPQHVIGLALLGCQVATLFTTSTNLFHLARCAVLLLHLVLLSGFIARFSLFGNITLPVFIQFIVPFILICAAITCEVSTISWVITFVWKPADLLAVFIDIEVVILWPLCVQQWARGKMTTVVK